MHSVRLVGYLKAYMCVFFHSEVFPNTDCTCSMTFFRFEGSLTCSHEGCTSLMCFVFYSSNVLCKCFKCLSD